MSKLFSDFAGKYNNNVTLQDTGIKYTVITFEN